MQTAIFISPGEGRHWLWAENGNQAERGSLSGLAAWYAGRNSPSRLILLVPGEDVLLTRVAMPTRNPSKISQALPFALEEHTLEDPAGLHCVPGSWEDQEILTCAAISRDRLKTLLDELADHGIVPDSACPDSLCIPWQEGTIQVAKTDSRALVRWSDSLAAASDSSTLELLVEGIRAGNALGQSAVEYIDADDELDLLNLFAQHAGRLPLDLLQGEFLPAQSRAGWRSWRLPAALAVAVLLSAVTLEFLQSRELDRNSAVLAEAIGEQFHAAFPHVTRIQADPGPQVELELRRLRQMAGSGQDRFLQLLSVAAPALAASPGISLERLQFRDGQLELGLAAQQIAELDALRSRLQAAGLTANQGATQLDNDRVSGTITLSSTSSGPGS